MQEYTSGVQPVKGYQLIKFLGRGGFGQVWKATAPGGIPIAMKLIDLQEQQALKELRALNFMRMIKHPHLVPIIGLWVKDDQGEFLDIERLDFTATTSQGPRRPSEVIIAMGLGDKNLLDRLRECQKQDLPGIPAPELLSYMEESAKGIDYLNQTRHDLGSGAVSILHCDIKPQNILIVGDTAQVCDFGLARVVTEASVSNPIYTAAYVAPEMLRDNKPSSTTDQYSLAISYVEMRTGALPFSATGPAMLYAHLSGKLDLSRLSPAEESVIRKATDSDSTKRYPNCLEMARALRRAVEGTSSIPGISVRPTGPLLLMPEEEIVPGYKLKRLLGKGGYGAVWEAWAPGGIKVALKIVRNLDAPSGKQEFRALELMKSVKHRSLLEIHAYWLLDKEGQLIPDEVRDQPNAPRADTLVLATQIAQGNLGDRLKEAQAEGSAGIPPKELLNYLWQVSEALDYLNQPQHKLGDRLISIVHRDIKPENILIADNTIKVADFGLAKILEGTSAEVHAESVGMTLAYAAPELMENRVTPWTDQYALALTYYRLRTGFMPFGVVQSQEELIAIHITGRLDLGRLPQEEQEVLRIATALKPESRYSSCLDMVRALVKACRVTEADIVLPQSHVQTGRGLIAEKTRRAETAAPARVAAQQNYGQTAASYASIKPLTDFPGGSTPSLTPPSLPDTGQEQSYRQETDWQVPSSPYVPETGTGGPLELVKPTPPAPQRNVMVLVIAAVILIGLGVAVALWLIPRTKEVPIASGTGPQPVPTVERRPTETEREVPRPSPTATIPSLPTQPQQTPKQGPSLEKALDQLRVAKAARVAQRWTEVRTALKAAEAEAPPENPEIRTRLQLELALLDLQGEPRDLAGAAARLREAKTGAFRLPPTDKIELARGLAAWARLEPEADAWRVAVDMLQPLLNQGLPNADQLALTEDYAELVSTHLDELLAEQPDQAWLTIRSTMEKTVSTSPWTRAVQAEAMLMTYSPGRVPTSARQVIDQALASAEVGNLPLKILPYLKALSLMSRAESRQAAETLANADTRAPWTASNYRKQRAVSLLRQAALGLRQPATERQPFRDPKDAGLATDALKQAERWDGKSLAADDLVTFTLAAWLQRPLDKELLKRIAAKALDVPEIEKKPWGCEAILAHIAVQEPTRNGMQGALKGYLRLAPLIPDRWMPDPAPGEVFKQFLKPAIDLGDEVARSNPPPDLDRQLASLHAAVGRLLWQRNNLFAAWPVEDPLQRGYEAFYAAQQRDQEQTEYENGLLYFQALKELRDARRVRENTTQQPKYRNHLAKADSAILKLSERKALEATLLRARLRVCEKNPGAAYIALSDKTGGGAQLDERYLPLLQARVELCLNYWKSLSDPKPEEELRIAEQAVRLAADPVSKAIAEANLALLHRKYQSDLKINVPNALPASEVEKRLESALTLAPNHPLAWSWQALLGESAFIRSKDTALPPAERRRLAEAALHMLENAAADKGLEAPDDEDRLRFNRYAQAVRSALEKMPR